MTQFNKHISTIRKMPLMKDYFSTALHCTATKQSFGNNQGNFKVNTHREAHFQ